MRFGLGKAVDPGADARRTEREDLRVPATIILAGGATTAVFVDNLSTTGFHASMGAEMAVGSDFRISLIRGSARRARVVWREGNCAGCEFIAP